MMRSGISLPMLAATICLGCSRRRREPTPVRPRRRAAARDHRRPDRRRASERAAARLRCGAASRSGSARSTPSAIRSPSSIGDGRLLRGNTALAALLGRPVTEIRGSTVRATSASAAAAVPHCAVGRALGAGQRRARRACTIAPTSNSQRDDLPGRRPGPTGASVVQVAKNVTEEIRSARRLRQMSDELGQDQRAVDGDARSVEVHAGAAAAGGEALGDRSARRRRRSRVEQSADERHRLRAAARGRAAIGRAAAIRPPRNWRRDLRRIAEESAARRAASSATCSRSPGGRPRRARRRTSPDLVQRVLALRTYEFG